MCKLVLLLFFIIMPLISNELDSHAVKDFLTKYPHMTEKKINDAFIYSKKRNLQLLLLNPEVIEDCARKYAESNRRAKRRRDEKIANLDKVILDKELIMKKFAGQITEDQFNRAVKAYKRSPSGGLPIYLDRILELNEIYSERKTEKSRYVKDRRFHTKFELETKVVKNREALLRQYDGKITPKQLDNAIAYCKKFYTFKNAPTTLDLIIAYSERWEKMQESKRKKEAFTREKNHKYHSDNQNCQANISPQSTPENQQADQRMKIDFLLH